MYYGKALKSNSESGATIKGLVISYLKLGKFRRALRFTKEIDLASLGDPVIFIALFKCVIGLHESTSPENSIKVDSSSMVQCMDFLNQARIFSNNNVPLLQEISLEFYSIKCFENVNL